ncbi:DUF4198 domain-containing protein [Undibacterium cyanobacteriorum]|uniref:DUF4198 domain-containing protein n=1 Tax=Undibacterium cyanobacteriorum TaxID=3073561 RepID=A0ABY9RM03_9BURK|nr:DUF4198 domain-containing protein [Undibacterium sp. 20NA77.5]WMW81295.1 DUF4198 domain-containing protein [Undibacterium sp. 20NA77.5]
MDTIKHTLKQTLKQSRLKLTLAALTIVAGSTMLASSAHADRPFILPGMTLNSGNAPLITFDAAVGENVFYFDHNTLSIDNLVITAADGSIVKPEGVALGKLRNSFDLRATLQGTYKVSIVNDFIIANYKENGAPKRWRGTVEAFAKEVPANAEELQVLQAQSRIETFVTNGKPTQTALQATGKGLELGAVSHPNDIVDGEPATFKMLLDGKPAAGIKVTVIPGGARYRQNLGEKNYTTDAEGKFTVQWQGAGMYWMQARANDNKAAISAAKERRASYVATLEVMPQ